MHHHYGDILSRIAEPPLWFDENAVPRFDPFTVDRVANIYANEVALVRITCQGCKSSFDVAFSGVKVSRPLPADAKRDGPSPMIRDHIRARTLHYGDPPNIRCCAGGPSMNSVPRQVMEYWIKPVILGEGMGCDIETGKQVLLDRKALKFRRNPAFEIDITPDGAR
ncbi:MAG: hypothetical protein AAGA94_11455 [Pseudomonadota bacterium]